MAKKSTSIMLFGGILSIVIAGLATGSKLFAARPYWYGYRWPMAQIQKV